MLNFRQQVRRESRSLSRAAAIAAGLVLCIPAVAHHSFAPLRTADGQDVIEVYEGNIEIYKLLNPHTALILNLVGENGEVEDWLVEMSSLASLVREGWTDASLRNGEPITVAILRAQSPRRGRLRAILAHGDGTEPGRLLVAYGIRGETPVMQRLRERLPACDGIVGSEGRSACFLVDEKALHALEQEFPGPMGWVMP